MAALLLCYLLLAALPISGVFGSPFFVHDVISHRQDLEEKHLEPIWDSDVLQHIRRFYSLNPPRFLRSKFYENMKYHQSHFPASWASLKHRDSAQAQSVTSKASTVPVAKLGFWKGLSIQDIRLDPIIRSEENERSGHPGLQQSVDAAQQGVMEREPIEMTKQTLDIEENSTIIESTEEIGHPDSMDASESVRSEEVVKKETDDIFSTKETSTTEAVTDNSRLEERTTDFVHDEVDKRTKSIYDRISEGTSPAKIHLSTTTDTVTKTVSSIHSTTDSKPSTVDERSSEEMSPSTTSISTTTVTGSETASSILPTAESKHSTTDGSSSSIVLHPSSGIPSSMTQSPTTTVTVSETVSSILSTAYSKRSTVDGGPSSRISPSTTSFPTTTDTVSSTPSTGKEETTTELAINMPKIRTAKIILSSVLLVIGLVAVAVMAVCIFRERRRKVKYDQLKLLP